MNKEILQVDRKTLFSIKIFLLILDIIALILLFFQIKLQEVSYSLHTLLVIINIIILILKPRSLN